MTAKPAASPEFWSFSLRVYARPGVAAECLELQERDGVNVNLLLFCAYCGAKFRAKLSPEELAAAAALVSSWHADVTRSLRMARISIRRLARVDASAANANPVETLRQGIKQLELAAERIEHAMLEDWWQARRVAVSDLEPGSAISSNIVLLLGRRAETPALMAAVLAERG